jgi:hypothetical protein
VKWRTFFLLIVLGVVASACTNDNPAISGARTPSSGPTWRGYPRPAEGRGEISVAGFNQFIKETNPPLNTSPIRAAAEFIYGGGASREAVPFTTTVVQKASPEGGTEASVTVTEEGLLDDAIAAVRFRLAFRRQKDDTWQLLSAFVDQKCARGPQTQEFTVEPCV